MREPRECGQIPYQQQSMINSHHSVPDPEPRPAPMKAAKRRGQLEVTPVLPLNPNLIAHLGGHSNEAPVIVDGQETTASIDSGTQMSSVGTKFCEDLALQIKLWDQLLELEGMGLQPSHTLGLWRLTSRSQGLETTTRMCCCWLCQPWLTLRQFWSWLVPK